MKKIICLITISLLILSIHAQETKPYFGIKGGINQSNLTKDSDAGIDNNNVLTSFQAGVFADIPLGGALFSFQPTLAISGKGVKYDLVKVDNNNYGSVKINPYYLNFQPNIVVNIPLSSNIKIFAGGGPYAAAGIFGKAKFEGKILGINIDKDTNIKYTNNKLDNTGATPLDEYARLKRFDWGVNAVAGIRFSFIVISANYEWGMVDLHPGTSDSKNAFGRNRLLSASLGLIF